MTTPDDVDWEELFRRDHIMDQLAEILRCKPDDVLDKVRKMQDEAASLREQIDEIRPREDS